MDDRALAFSPIYFSSVGVWPHPRLSSMLLFPSVVNPCEMKSYMCYFRVAKTPTYLVPIMMRQGYVAQQHLTHYGQNWPVGPLRGTGRLKKIQVRFCKSFITVKCCYP